MSDFQSFPKPARTPRKAKQPIARSAPPKKINRARMQSTFQRCYHSRERVRWVKSLGCGYCTMVSPLIGLATCGKSENAHTVGDGAGRKAGYKVICPMCPNHHRRYDCHEFPFNVEIVRDAMKALAAETQRRWVERCAALEGTDTSRRAQSNNQLMDHLNCGSE